MTENTEMTLSEVPLNCDSVEQMLDCYLDDELSAQSRAEVESHMARCESCTLLLHESQVLMDMARSLADRPIPELVSLRLRQFLISEIEKDKKTSKPLSPPRLSVVK